ncbi:HNH endonuclease [Gordonia malaquae]|uniref:HNH endonuclease n=1 Tax=Gordonia malaquae TaxID=410332 RepID=UPI003015F13D
MSGKQPDWTWPEIVVAGGVQFAAGWSGTIRQSDERAIELSSLLRDANPLLANDLKFRSVGSLQRKLEDLRTAHPEYSGKKTRGGRVTAAVVEAYVQNPTLMRALAARFRAEPALLAVDADLDGEDGAIDLDAIYEDGPASAVEGAVRRRIATFRERDPKLRQRKIDHALQRNGCLACEICQFDFEAKYGALGQGYAHVHHIVPLHVTDEVVNTLDDLIVVCANCHAMIHRRRPWKTPEELVEIVSLHGSAVGP